MDISLGPSLVSRSEPSVKRRSMDFTTTIFFMSMPPFGYSHDSVDRIRHRRDVLQSLIHCIEEGTDIELREVGLSLVSI